MTMWVIPMLALAAIPAVAAADPGDDLRRRGASAAVNCTPQVLLMAFDARLQTQARPRAGRVQPPKVRRDDAPVRRQRCVRFASI
ncbi:hypothetical protein ABC347_10735 [Sphingomonas sp. 1P06PA]|uniref:hypothetical protein n=1 Tax=Sphingomonas sp. 1P06PA TaxID=554121 RepID=UPI0039A6E5D9